MSSNGNPLVVQHNRASANISVFNYPEHLNPFYANDNHRRLRFWKLNTQDNCDAARKRSFSIDGLKGIWSFKSFRLRKKFSSLRINKNPESSPKLRRKDFNSERDFNINDSDYMHTKAILPRNNQLRNMHGVETTNSNFMYDFNRNGHYRRTIQVTSTCQKSLCLMTTIPIFCGSFTSETVDGIKSCGLSQKSAMRTNPFDTDDDTDILECTHPMNPSTSKPERRKKRRAPLPPSISEQTRIAEEISNIKSNSLESNQQNQNDHTEQQTISALISEMKKFLPMPNKNSIMSSKNPLLTNKFNALKITEKFDKEKAIVKWEHSSNESCDKVKHEPQFSLKSFKSNSMDNMVHAGDNNARWSLAHNFFFNSEKNINLSSDETKALSKKMDLNEKALNLKQLHPQNNLSPSVLCFNPLKIIEPFQFNDRSYVTDNLFEKSQLTVPGMPISGKDQTVSGESSRYVQEIIESITKSQRLLNAPLQTKNLNFLKNRCKNANPEVLFSHNGTHSNSEYGFKILESVSETNYFYEHEQDDKNENQLETNDSQRSICVISPSEDPNYSQSHYNRKSVHQHGSREFISPETNSDWNQVPKPRRAKDIAHEELNEKM